MSNKPINSSDIIIDSEENAMPVPETNNYNEEPQQKEENIILKPTVKFIRLFEDCLGKLPYNSILVNGKNEKIKLTDLFNFMNAKQNGMSVADMNAIIAFIAPVEHNIVAPLMNIIDNKDMQKELWTLEA